MEFSIEILFKKSITSEYGTGLPFCRFLENNVIVAPIESATDDGSTYIYGIVNGVKTTDTIAGVATTTPNFCGGAVSSGKAQGTPMVAIASGKYGWVLLQSPDAVSA